MSYSLTSFCDSLHGCQISSEICLHSHVAIFLFYLVCFVLNYRDLIYLNSNWNIIGLAAIDFCNIARRLTLCLASIVSLLFFARHLQTHVISYIYLQATASAHSFISSTTGSIYRAAGKKSHQKNKLFVQNSKIHNIMKAYLIFYYQLTSAKGCSYNMYIQNNVDSWVEHAFHVEQLNN